MEFLLKKMVYFRKHHASNKYHLVKDGFSLIELLATIAVMAILVAIIIPVIGSVRNSAKTTKSLSNLRQIASAMQMYSSDNNGLYPVGYYQPPAGTGYNTYWYLEIASYLDQKSISNKEGNNILISPFLENEITTTGFVDGGGEVRNSPSTYSVHGLICASVYRFPVWNIEENHSEIILVGEGTQIAATGFAQATFTRPDTWVAPDTTAINSPDSKLGGTYSDNGVEIDIDESTEGALSYRANNHALVAFLDGHVEAIPRGKVRNKNVVIDR